MQHDFMISSLVSLIFHNKFCGYWIVVSSPKHLPSGVPFQSRALRDAQYGIPTSTISTAASSTKLRLENLGPYSISSPPKNRPGKKTSHFKGLQIYESWHFTLSYEVKDMVRIPHQSHLAISTYFRTFPSSHPEAFLGCASSMLAKIKKTYSPKQWWFDVDLPVKSWKKKHLQQIQKLTWQWKTHPWMKISYISYWKKTRGFFNTFPTNPRFNPWHSFGPPWVFRLRCGAISPTLSPSDARASGFPNREVIPETVRLGSRGETAFSKKWEKTWEKNQMKYEKWMKWVKWK